MPFPCEAMRDCCAKLCAVQLEQLQRLLVQNPFRLTSVHILEAAAKLMCVARILRFSFPRRWRINKRSFLAWRRFGISLIIAEVFFARKSFRQGTASNNDVVSVRTRASPVLRKTLPYEGLFGAEGFLERTSLPRGFAGCAQTMIWTAPKAAV